MACLRVAAGREGLQIWRVTANIVNKKSQTADNGWPFKFGVGRGVNNSSPYEKKNLSRNVTQGLGLRLWSDVGSGKWKRVDWTHRAQGKDKRQALVNTVLNLRVP